MFLLACSLKYSEGHSVGNTLPEKQMLKTEMGMFTTHITNLNKSAMGTCSASILNEYTLLTAAHCVGFAVRPGAGVYFGYMSFRKPMIPKSYVSHAIPHPLFNISHPGHDIAVVHLEKPLEQPDSVVLYAGDQNKLVGLHGYSSGFGVCLRDKLRLSIPMRVKKKTILDCGLLNTLYDLLGYQLQNHICSTLKEACCPGDSGGPLAIKSRRDQSYVQIGITSWGCRWIFRIIGKKGYDFYTSISSYIPWILENAKGQVRVTGELL